MRIFDELKKLVCYVGYKHQDGTVRWGGTAFTVCISLDAEIGTKYIVTARHVIEEVEKRGTDEFVYLRWNGISCNFVVGTVRVDLWTHHENAAVDLSTVSFHIEHCYADYREYPFEKALSDKERIALDIGSGNDVCCTGLFVNHAGRERNEPILRSGMIASVPEDVVQTRLGPVRAYIAELRSIGGLSGSPVFTIVNDEIRLLGVIHGHWETAPVDSQSDDPFFAERLNKGLAIITPVDELIVLLNCEKLKARRMKEWENPAQFETMPYNPVKVDFVGQHMKIE